mgnify:CR=1 FL=1
MTDKGAPVVNVYSIDEEKLRFRSIIAIEAVGNIDGRGEYEVDLSIPTFYGNNEDYNSARIKCDSFIAYGPDNPAGIGADSIWADANGPSKIAAIELQIASAPSSQTTLSCVNTPANALEKGFQENSGFRQILPGQVIATNNDATMGSVAAGDASNRAWLSISGRAENPIIAANPFGQTLRVKFVNPVSRLPVYIRSAGGAANDTGIYIMQLEITMIPNKGI